MEDILIESAFERVLDKKKSETIGTMEDIIHQISQKQEEIARLNTEITELQKELKGQTITELDKSTILG